MLVWMTLHAARMLCEMGPMVGTRCWEREAGLEHGSREADLQHGSREADFEHGSWEAAQQCPAQAAARRRDWTQWTPRS
eukprot:353355-Chlamydomonas_euryale.AAC.2